MGINVEVMNNGRSEERKELESFRRKSPNNSLKSRIMRNTAVIGLAAGLYFVPSAKAQAPTLSPTVESELSNLVVANGGSATTIPSIVNNTRSDGINLNSTVAQLGSVSDVPIVLDLLDVNNFVPQNFTLYQAFTQLYDMSSEFYGTKSGSPNLTVTRMLANSLEIGGQIISHNVAKELAGKYSPNLDYELCTGVLTASLTKSNAPAQMSYTLNASNLNASTVNLNIGPMNINANLSGSGGPSVSPSLTSLDNQEVNLGSTEVTCTSCTACPSVSITPFTATSISIDLRANVGTTTATSPVIQPHQQNTHVSNPFVAILDQDVETATGILNAMESNVKSEWNSITMPNPSVSPCGGGYEAFCGLTPTPITTAGISPFSASDSGVSFPTGDWWVNILPQSVDLPLGEIFVYGVLGNAAVKTPSNITTLSFSGTGAPSSPYMPNTNGTINWKGPASYNLTINHKIGGVESAGTYYITDQAFVETYNKNILNSLPAPPKDLVATVN